MAYAAATCLKNTILRLLNHPSISLVPPSPETIQLALSQAQSLQLLLEEVDKSSKSRSRKTVNALDAQIREAVFEFDDILESCVTQQLLSQSHPKRGNRDGIEFFINLLDLKQDIHSFTERVRELKRAYKTALQTMPEDDDCFDGKKSHMVGLCEDDDCFDGKKSHMVGLCDQFRNLKDWVTGTYPRELSLNKIIGMGGIGKTNLAKHIFEDPEVSSHFQCRAWVKVGRKYELKDMLRAIIAQANSCNAHTHLEKHEEIAHYLKQSLKGCRFLIVLDDVWDVPVWRGLLSLIPDDKNGSRVLLTTRSSLGGYSRTMVMRFLTKEESWDLLREKVFAQGQLCPRQLEKVGKKIAEKCDGLPLTIITIAKLLSKAETTPEYWNQVAENRNSVFTDAYNEISKVLYPSYDYLPQHLKMCFICTGVLPERYVIPRYKLINMWIVEEFLKETKESNDYLYQLVQNTLVMVYQWSSTRYPNIKTCGVHSSLWHLCKIEARKNKYFHVLSSRKDGLSEDIKGQRRLCIHNNVLFAIKDVHTSLEDDCASTVRSLGCFGTYHPYQVPITFGLRLLSLLDALTIRFYEFPMEVLKLVQLRYLALTCNGNLPASISKLWNLRFLIVRPHQRMIKSYRAPSYLPVEIWNMKQLKHLHIIGYDLPDPKDGSFFPNLSSVLDVSGDTCTKGVLSRIFNLRKLVLRIELKPDVDEPLSCFAHISCLEKLKIFKCIIVNPVHKAEIFASHTPFPNFPSSIKKLTLSGLGYPWEKISRIASLPKLQVLKLRNCAFRGPKWEVKDNEFNRLKSLVIEDADLVQWKVGSESFSMLLNRMSFKHCYKLQEIHWGPSTFFPIDVQVVDCNPLVLASLKQIKINTHCHHVTFDSHSTWVDGELNNQVSVYPGL